MTELSGYGITRLKSDISQNGSSSGGSRMNSACKLRKVLAQCGSLWLQDRGPHFSVGCQLMASLGSLRLSIYLCLQVNEDALNLPCAYISLIFFFCLKLFKRFT